MSRYILRRIWQIVPTVLGVIIITFILFNIVGGSPALMTLGKKVSPKALEEFDEQRGFNKPLFFGNWTGTRAFTDAVFEHNAGPWRDNSNVVWKARAGAGPARIVLAPGRDIGVPLAFGLKPETRYRWTVCYRLKEGSATFRLETGKTNGLSHIYGHSEQREESRWQRLTGFMRSLAFARDDTNSAFDGSAMIRPLKAGNKWQTGVFDFSTAGNPPGLKFTLKSKEAPLEIKTIKLRRQPRHFFDSQFVFYLSQIAKFDFGKSTYSNQRVARMLADGIRPSLFLTVPIFLIGLISAVSIALVCAFFRDTWLDRFFVVIAVVLMSVNYLVWIIVGQYFFAYRLNWFPIWGFESLGYLLLPVLIGVVSGLGDSLRFYRTIMLDEMYRDYVRTAFAKGVSRSGVLFRHVLKNAMIPILTNVIIAIPFLYTGSLLLETFFGIPGLGNMGINAINYSDVDVVRAIVLIGALLYVAANLVTDICYAFVDPRVRLG